MFDLFGFFKSLKKKIEKKVSKKPTTEEILISFAEANGWFYPENQDREGRVTLVRYGLEHFGVRRTGSTYKRRCCKMVEDKIFQKIMVGRIAHFNLIGEYDK